MAGPSLFRPSDLSTDLIAYWKFDSDGTDEQGNYDLTPVNTPAYTTEDYWRTGEDSCDLVAASTQHYTSARDTDLDLLDRWSIALWMKPDDVTSVSILSKGFTGSKGYALYLDSGKNLDVIMGGTQQASSPQDFLLNKWVHVVAQYDQTNSTP